MPHRPALSALSAAAICLAGLGGAASAQDRGPLLAQRGDVLDTLNARIAQCRQTADRLQRLDCYDALVSSQLGGGGAATQGGGPVAQLPPAQAGDPPSRDSGRPVRDEDRAYDPRANVPRQAMRLPDPPESEIRRRQGPRPAPNNGLPLFTIQVSQLRHFNGVWEMTLSATNHAQRAIDPVVHCVFTNGGTTVAERRFVPRNVQPGETASVDMSGPPITVFVDGARCDPISPFI